ncbi:MAG TPA: hypothetical protein VNJ53_07525 [Gaiellaceae bacterium]|nr:hypothetical protein [Gaiellaceae bacterium]
MGHMRRRLAPFLVAGAFVLAGCGGDGGADATDTTTETTVETTETTTETTGATASGDPLTCLEDAGLSSVEERSSDFWRGYHDSPFYQVSVQLLASEAEARDLARDAVDVYAAQAGEYVVTGPAKASAGGQVGPDEAAEAEALVQDVAACVGG